MPITRREILTAGIPLVTATMSGCAEAIPGGCGSMNKIKLRAEPVTLSEAEKEATDPFVSGNFSREEQRIFRKAIKNDAYTDCIGSESDGIRRFRERMDTKSKQGSCLEYLLKDGTYYTLYFGDGDNIEMT